MGYARRTLQIAGDLCRPCIRRHFRSYTLTTLFLGWWGISSIVLTPIILVTNFRQYLLARHISDPPLASFHGPHVPPPPITSSGMFAIKLIYGIVVWSGVLLVVAYSQVDLTEKYFPALNAAMHNNGSEDEPYVDYVFVRIRADMSALESASNNSTWAGTRSDLLHNESSLVDLETQNAKLQDTLARERFSNVGANVVCERWAINEFGPALKNYTASKRAFFLAAKANPTITPENDLAVQAILGQERESSRHLQQILSDSGASCPK